MAEYYAVLSKAVASLEVSSPESRRAVYDKARNALIGQLKAIVPPLPTSEISRQRLELEEAIRRAEREATAAGSAGSARPVSRPATAAPAPPPPPPPPPVEDVVTDDGRPSPQDVFRRAIQEAESRGSADAAPIERAPPPPPRRDYDDDRVEIRRDERSDRPPPRDEPPTYTPASDYRRGGAPAPRLAPDYDWEPAPAPPPAPQSRYAQDPYIDGRDRPSKIRDARRRGGREEEPDGEIDIEEVRPSRLPTILLLVVIVAMAGGLAALAWSQRDLLSGMLAGLDSGPSEPATPAPPPPQAAAPAAPASSKDLDRLPGSTAPADVASPGVRVVQPQGGAAAPPVPAAPAATGIAAPLVGQKAALYEEPLDSAAAAKGVTQIAAAVTWSFVADSSDGPQVVAQLDVPDRKLKIRLAVRKNTDKSIPASHLVEVTATVPPDFPGKGIKSVPRLVLKPAEDARGQPLIGASAKVADGFFWIALSALDADIKGNLGLLRDRGWIDLPLVYDSGQRAILTFEKGNQGDRAFQQAIAAWGG